jgi:hypothetical protein
MTPTAIVRLLCLVPVAACVLVGCDSRPEELTRRASIDAVCSGGLSAYTYPLQTPDGGRTAEKLLGPATNAGCVAPIGAWTEPMDAKGDAVRKEVLALRESEATTVLCCP